MCRRQFLALTTAVVIDCSTRQIFSALAEGYSLQQDNAARDKIKGLIAQVHYRPIAARVAGLKNNTVSIECAWRINVDPGRDVRLLSLHAATWGNFNVPGQWAQQGYEIPIDKSVAVATEFHIPAAWAGYRIFVRFDAIHSGTHYWLNGQPLGYSENLFTPVEWEITAAAKTGQLNRLDLEMKVATASERLSYSSGYTGYTLGGIDRAVRIYALPKLHVSSLRLHAGLDKTYENGELQIVVGLDNPDRVAPNGLAVVVQIFDARGNAIEHSNPKVVLGSLQSGPSKTTIESHVPKVLQWNAEQPNLYKLVLILEKDGKTIEQIERNIGFRTVETRDRQLYVNGVRVKLAGVCHHEINPLTGRADTMRHGEEDVKLFKSANLNYVRTSHYPCTQEFLDAADKYGLYVESEAPLCWVAPAKDLTDLNAVLTATSAMIDYNHAHPSVIIWSLANESHWSRLFEESNKLCKQLDATRPTTIEHVFSDEDKVTCDIISRHYQPMPYDNILKHDTRPFLHGECFFLVYHERTDVAINPGLRELWAAGSADPNSAWGKSCLANVQASPGLIPGIYPGAWSYIYESPHCIGSEIWSGVDDIAYLPGGKIASSERGNAYWGLIDGWRRPKPELDLARFVFSPIWFPVGRLDYKQGESSVRVPVQNRYSFTNLSHFDFVWEVNGKKGTSRINIPPASKGEIEIPIEKGTPEGSTLLLRVMSGSNEIVNATLSLGASKKTTLPMPRAGAPEWNDNGKLITIEGSGFSLVFDRTIGDFDSANSLHKAPIIAFPCLHVTRHDFGDLDSKKPPYREFPDIKMRVVDGITAIEMANGLELTVNDRYEHFAGAVRWLIDKEGVGKISYDYVYTGADLDSREIGMKTLLRSEYDEVKWRRWSEWGIFPKDSICRTEGSAKAHRDKRWPTQPANVKPAWPWSQDQTELGTADFRSIKFHIYEATLVSSDGSGVQVDANADVHFRACLSGQGINMYVLTQCPLAPMVLKTGTRLMGDFSFRLMA